MLSYRRLTSQSRPWSRWCRVKQVSRSFHSPASGSNGRILVQMQCSLRFIFSRKQLNCEWRGLSKQRSLKKRDGKWSCKYIVGQNGSIYMCKHYKITYQMCVCVSFVAALIFVMHVFNDTLVLFLLYTSKVWDYPTNTLLYYESDINMKASINSAGDAA